MSLMFDALRSKKKQSVVDNKSDLLWSDAHKTQQAPAASLRLIVALALILLIVGTLVLGVRSYLSSTMLKTAALNPSSLTLAENVVSLTTVEVGKSLSTTIDHVLENYHNKRFADNNDILKEALINYSENIEINNLAGLNYLKQNRLIDAEIYFNKALQINDKCAECYNNLGYLLTIKLEPIKAENYLKKALSIKPELADAYFNLAVLYQKHGDLGQAQTFFEHYLKMSKKDDEQVYIQTKAYVQAMRDI